MNKKNIEIEEWRHVYDNPVANRYFDLTPKQIRYLSLYSTKDYLDFLEFFSEQKDHFIGIMHELQQVAGNWTFKDRVLPRLFQEGYDILIKILNRFSELYDHNFNTTFTESIHYNPTHTLRRKYNLLKYLTERYNELFLIHKKPLSYHYSHLDLKKTLRRMNKRLSNILSEIQDFYIIKCRDTATEGLVNYIQERLDNLSLPYANYLSGLVHQISPKMYGLSPCQQPEDLDPLFYKCFSAHCGNTEYNLGLSRVWASSKNVYFFNGFTEGRDESLVLLTEHRISDFTSSDNFFPGIISGKKNILDLFIEAEQEGLFRAWFNSENVKKQFYWEFYYSTTKKIRKNADTPDALTDEDFTKTTKLLKKRLKQMNEYYGLTYEYEEMKELIIQKELDSIENLSYLDDEVKEQRKELIKKLYPKIKQELDKNSNRQAEGEPIS